MKDTPVVPLVQHVYKIDTRLVVHATTYVLAVSPEAARRKARLLDLYEHITIDTNTVRSTDESILEFRDVVPVEFNRATEVTQLDEAEYPTTTHPEGA